MKNSYSLILLSIVVAFIVIVSLVYIIFLPYFVTSGLPRVSEQGRSLRTGNEPVSYQVIKIAHGLPRYHPLHQSLSQDFAAALETQTELNIIVEIYPENSLGPDSQILKGTSRGTVEICIVREEQLRENSDLYKGLVNLAAIKSPVRYIWKITDKMTYSSNTIAIVYRTKTLEERVQALGLEPLMVGSGMLEKTVRQGRAAYVVLDLLEWYYKDWYRWTVSSYTLEDLQSKYLMLGNANFIENLNGELQNILLSVAARFGERASELIRINESEIEIYSGLNGGRPVNLADALGD